MIRDKYKKKKIRVVSCINQLNEKVSEIAGDSPFFIEYKQETCLLTG